MWTSITRSIDVDEHHEEERGEPVLQEGKVKTSITRRKGVDEYYEERCGQKVWKDC